MIISVARLIREIDVGGALFLAEKQKSKTKSKPQAKGNTSNKNSKPNTAAPNKKPVQKKKEPDPRKKDEVQKYIINKKKNKIIFLLLFSLIFLLFYIVQGEKFWLVLHENYWGLFGFLGFMIPVLNIYSVNYMLKKNSSYRLIFRLILFSGTIIAFASTIFAFSSSGIELSDYGTEMIQCYRNGGQHIGTGMLGGLFGIPIAKIFGATGGGIISFLLFIVLVYKCLLVLFGKMMKMIQEPLVKKVADTMEIRTLVRDEERKIKAEQRQAFEEFKQRNAEKKAVSPLQEDTKPEEQPVVAEEEKKLPETNDEEAKPKQNNNFVRLDKEVIYRPGKINDDAPKKKKNIKENIVKNFTAVFGAKHEADEEGKKDEQDKTEQKPEKIKEKPAENIKKDKNDNTVNMEHIGEDIPEFSGKVTVDYKKINSEEKRDTENTAESDKYINGEYFSPVYEKPKKMKNIPKNKETNPKPTEKKIKISLEDVKRELQGEQMRLVENNYLLPPFTLLDPQPEENDENISIELNHSAEKLVETLKSFGVQTSISHISRGPSVTRYELQPAAGVKISKITNLSDDIAMNLAATGVRIEAPIPGKSAVGIEVPNKNVSIVKMRSLLESKEFQNAKSRLTVVLGVDITGKITLADLGRMPHLLIAGSTGSGKSVCINSMLISLLYKASPDEVKLMLIDPKVVELGIYNGIPHLLVPVVTDPRKAAGALNWAVNEMLERYKTFASYNVRDMHSYNRLVDKQNKEVEDSENVEETERSFEEDEMLAQAKAEINIEDSPKKEVHKLEKMAQIVIVIDELADLMMAAPNEVEESICRLAQMARAAGMHLVIATQRPSVDVITGLIKANVPSRIAFAVKSQIDSRTILDSGGAEKLLGKGDMLFSPIGVTKPVRVQGGFVDDTEIENVINFIKNSKIVEYDKKVIDEIEKNAVLDGKDKNNSDAGDGEADIMLEEAIECVVEAGQASTSLLQRRLRVGYARAGRLIDDMEKMGIVGPHQGAKPRDVLMTRQQLLERNLKK